MIEVNMRTGTIGFKPDPDNILKIIRDIQNIRINIVEERPYIFPGRQERTAARIKKKQEYLKKR